MATTFDLNSEQTILDARTLWEVFGRLPGDPGNYTDPQGIVHAGKRVRAYQRRLWTAAFPEGDSANGNRGTDRLRRMSASSRLKFSSNVVHLEPGVKDRPTEWFVRSEWNDTLLEKQDLNGSIAPAAPVESPWVEVEPGLYKCKYCPYTAPSTNSVRTHQVRTIGDHSQLAVLCPVDGCKYVLTSYHILSEHISRMHPGFLAGRMLCSKCGELVDSRSALMYHNTEKHSKLELPPETPVGPTPAPAAPAPALTISEPSADVLGSATADIEALLTEDTTVSDVQPWSEDERALAELFVGLIRSGVRRQTASMGERVTQAEARADAAESALSALQEKARALFG